VHTLFSSAYFPPVEYLSAWLQAKQPCIDPTEHYRKQSYRTRAVILSGNGQLTLTVPVQHPANHTPVKDVRLDYATPWQRQHWRGIVSAYNNSPFFLFLQDFFYPFFEKRYTFLLDLNNDILQKVLSLLGYQGELLFQEETVLPRQEHDFRQWIHPRMAVRDDYPWHTQPPYAQVFEDKFGFVPHLSVLDLLFNKGNESANYLMSM
jgi:hypothetical protein